MTFGQKTAQNGLKFFDKSRLFLCFFSFVKLFSSLSRDFCFLQVVSVRKADRVCVVSLPLSERKRCFFSHHAVLPVMDGDLALAPVAM